MVSQTEQRIAERNAESEDRLDDQGPLARGMNRTGRVAANTVDRAQAPVESHTGSFLSGALIGALAGAGLGLVVSFLAAAVIPGGLAFGTVLAIEAISVAGMAFYEGKKSEHRHAEHPEKKHVSDRIAQRMGTVGVPGRTQDEQEQIDALQQPRFVQRLERERARQQRAEDRREDRELRRLDRQEDRELYRSVDARGHHGR